MINYKKIYEELIIFSYIGVMLFICFTGNLNKYLNPKMNIYFYLFVIVLGIFFVFGLKDMFKLNGKNKFNIKLSDALYLLPLLFIFFVNDGSLSAQTVSNKGLNVTSIQTSLNKGENVKNSDNEKVIEVTESNYIDIISDVSYYVDDYVGRRIKVTGFIHRDDKLGSNKFVLGRMYMSCCAADAQVIGYICSYDKQNELKDNSWYEVEAVINKTVYAGEDTALLDIKTVKEVEKPQSEYVY